MAAFVQSYDTLLVCPSILGVGSDIILSAHLLVPSSRPSYPFVSSACVRSRFSSDEVMGVYRYFWHQGTRQKFFAPAHLITFEALKIRHGTLLARYTVLLLTFVISGLFHQLADVAAGVPWWEARAVPFFAMQAVGILLEDTVQGVYRWISGRKRTDARPSGWKLWFGSCWVLVWLFWTTPLWAYPIMQRASGEPIIPFSVVRQFLK